MKKSHGYVLVSLLLWIEVFVRASLSGVSRSSLHNLITDHTHIMVNRYELFYQEAYSVKHYTL